VRRTRIVVFAYAVAAAVSASAQTPVNPTPVNPTPVSPTPVNPTPVNPTPANPTPVNPTPVNPTPVNPTNPTTTPNVTTPQTGPGPTTGTPFGIRLEIDNARPSDFAQVQRTPNVGQTVKLGASFYDTANGQTIQNACVPAYDLSNHLAPDGAARGEFVPGEGAVISPDKTQCSGACNIRFLNPGAFTVHAHCLDNPSISSAGNQGDFNFESSNAPWAGGHALQPKVPSLLHPQPAPGPTTAAAAKASGGGMSVGTQLLIGALLVLGTYEVYSLASGDSSGGGGGDINAYCFDVAASCSDAGRYCNMSSEADCETYESDVVKLCSCSCTITKSCYGCTAGVNGCQPMGGRSVQPIPPRALHTPQVPKTVTRNAPVPTPLPAASAGFPWLRAAEIALVVGATTFTVYELAHSKKPLRIAPWVGPEGGGLTLVGAW